MDSGQFAGAMLGYVAVVGVVLLIIFLVCREIVCWYFKINQNIALLTEIRDRLAATGMSHISSPAKAMFSTSPNMNNQSQGDIRERNYQEATDAAKQMAAKGLSAEDISKELQKRFALIPAQTNHIAKRVKSEPSPS